MVFDDTEVFDNLRRWQSTLSRSVRWPSSARPRRDAGLTAAAFDGSARIPAAKACIALMTRQERMNEEIQARR